MSDVYNTHHYTNTTDETCAVTLDAGMVCGALLVSCRLSKGFVASLFQDIDCGSFLDSFMGQAIQDGVLTTDAVDTALTHLFSVQFRLGMFDPSSSQPYTKIPASVVNSPAHQALALDAARQGIVLLKNDGVLPWKSSSLKTVAIIGPNGPCVVLFCRV